MIEVKPVRLKGTAGSTDELFIDGSIIDDGGAFPRRNKTSTENPNQTFDVTSYEKDTCYAITVHRFSDIDKNIRELELRGTKYHLIEDEHIFQRISILRSSPWRFWIVLSIAFESMSWKRLWSAKEYTDEFRLAVERHDTFNSYLTPPDADEGYARKRPRANTLWIPVQKNDSVMETEIRSHSQTLQHLHKLTQESLISKIRSDSVARIFDFPEEARIACEQYLLYFVQFLKDIGIEATAELQREAGEMIFTVTPKDKGEALGQIRRALDVYLNLPTNPNLGSSLGVTADIQTQRLVANIQHLHGQLMLANAAMQLKDAAIQQHQATIEQQRRFLTGEVLIESVQRAGGEDEDKEKILDGTVAITKYKGKWFEIDVPDIYRRIREYVFEQDDD